MLSAKCKAKALADLTRARAKYKAQQNLVEHETDRCNAGHGAMRPSTKLPVVTAKVKQICRRKIERAVGKSDVSSNPRFN